MVKAALLSAALALGASSALAQDLVYAPCLSRAPSLAAIGAAFEADGWRRATEAERDAAYAIPGENYCNFQFLPKAPETREEFAGRLAMGKEIAENYLPSAALLLRGNDVLAIQFGDGETNRDFACVFAGPDLSEVGDLPVPEDIFGGAPGFAHDVTNAFALPWIARARVDRIRNLPGFDPDTPTPGAEMIFVAVTRTEPLSND